MTDIGAFLGKLFKRSEPNTPPPPPIATYYKTLGVKPGASPETIKVAYEEQSRRLKEDLEQFSHDHRLKARMEELIRELDEAYKRVTTIS